MKQKMLLGFVALSALALVGCDDSTDANRQNTTMEPETQTDTTTPAAPMGNDTTGTGTTPYPDGTTMTPDPNDTTGTMTEPDGQPQDGTMNNDMTDPGTTGTQN